MRKLIASTFISLDGVLQAPGAPDEDPAQGFALGGWTFTYWDEVMAQSMVGFDGRDRELVLGRKTYEIFEAHWPYQPADDPTAQSLNAARKHVASRTLRSLDWNNSTLLGDDVVAAVAQLKRQPGSDLQIIGSGNLIQTLQAAALIDEYNLWIFPVVLGRGKRLFEATAKPAAMRLVSSKVSGTGVLLTTYVPAGKVPLGSFAQTQPSAKELERRARLRRESR
ncbi:MAG TPA: dihydrofolate reductase family protein [Steroidobacteraceae bacterium]|nr:dihydrofolate reductase family protein [Steroidobacteraceae bacterium]